MNYVNFNDYELLYLINENCEKAFDMLYYKYNVFVKVFVYRYNIPNYVKEDYIQEGLLILVKAIQRFDPEYNKSFFKYFEFILKRGIARIIQSRKYYDFNIINLDYTENLMAFKDISTNYNYKYLVRDPNIDQHLLKECIIDGLTYKAYSIKYDYNYKKLLIYIKWLKEYFKKTID